MQRGELRKLLIDSLPDDTVRWGHKVAGVRALGGGRHAVSFAPMPATAPQPQGPPPGWYTDAQGAQRWFDGQQWTPHVR